MQSGEIARYEARCENARIVIGDRVRIGRNVVFGPNCRNVEIGFGSFIGDDIYIDVEDLAIGEYTTIHHGSVVHGKKTVIGHNCWFGHYTIIDSLGGDTRIGNNVGVGAHSQLWSHMKFGDVLNGCRWNSAGRLYLDDDVWLVGHSIVGPIHAKARSMLLTGGVAMKDMEENCVYAGAPAQNISAKVGAQFDDPSPGEKEAAFRALVTEFCQTTGCDPEKFLLVDQFDDDSIRTQFNLRDRTYRPVRSEDEYQFIKFMLYEKAKWIPA